MLDNSVMWMVAALLVAWQALITFAWLRGRDEDAQAETRQVAGLVEALGGMLDQAERLALQGVEAHPHGAPVRLADHPHHDPVPGWAGHEAAPQAPAQASTPSWVPCDHCRATGWVPGVAPAAAAPAAEAPAEPVTVHGPRAGTRWRRPQAPGWTAPTRRAAR